MTVKICIIREIIIIFIYLFIYLFIYFFFWKENMKILQLFIIIQFIWSHCI